MGPILLDHPGDWPATAETQRAFDAEPTAAARGVLMALAGSSLAWIALALGVPLVW
jgi:hypothetical protein